MISSVLLDTCALLWILQGDERVEGNPEIRDLLNRHQVYYSALSAAEIGIKSSLGKLRIPNDWLSAAEEAGLKEWPVLAADMTRLTGLPYHHKDPFDRMVIACALNHNLIVLTADEAFLKYPVRVHMI